MSAATGTAAPATTAPTTTGPTERREDARGAAASVIAVDVGGTGIKAARVRFDGSVDQQVDVPTAVERGPDSVVDTICAVARSLKTPGTSAVGLCVPGLLDLAAGIVRYAPNLGLRDTALTAAVQDAVDIPVFMEHDVRAATRAEMRLGSGSGARDLLLVALGTGIAAGVVAAGALVEGATGAAGELGHLPVRFPGEACACGQHGCLEVYSSAGGVVRRFRAAGGSAQWTAADIVSRLDTDPVARSVWADATAALGSALISSTLLLDPALIVLAGGLSGAGERLLRPVREVLGAGLTWRPPPPVIISPLGGRAGLYGAALHVMDALGQRDRTTSWHRPRVPVPGDGSSRPS